MLKDIVRRFLRTGTKLGLNVQLQSSCWLQIYRNHELDLMAATFQATKRGVGGRKPPAKGGYQ